MDFRSVSKFFPFAFIGSLLGAWIVTLISPNVLKPLMLFMLAAVAVYTIGKKDWESVSAVKTLSPVRLSLLLLLLLAIGFYDGFLGPGTGSFFIFTFLLLGFDFLKAAGNAKLLNFGSNLAALLMFMYLGEVHYIYGLIMGAAQVFGAIVGSQFAIKKGSGFVRTLFIVVTFVLLIKNTHEYFLG